MKPYEKPLSPQEYLMHYGVKGMKWGVRRYQNKDGTLTKAGKERYSQNQQDGVDSFLKSVGSKKVSELTGSINEDLAIQAVTYVSAFAAVLAVKAVQNRMLRKGRMKELDRLNREKDIKDFDECPRLPRKMKAEESVKVTNPDYPDLGTTMNCTFCTTAMALREKGYDVQATKVSDGFFSDDFFKATFNSPEVKMGRKKSGQAVLDTLSQTGDGSYGNLTVAWKLGGKHSLFWKNEGGRTRIYDGQSGEEITQSPSKTRSFMDFVNLKTITYNRLDNCEPTTYALAAVERPKKM